MENTSVKWYSNTRWIVFFLFVFAPLGLFFLWLKNNFNSFEKTAITIVVGALIVLSILFPPTAEEFLSNSKAFVTTAISFFLILWGLTLFKITIRIMGGIIGFLIGSLLGLMMEIHPLYLAIPFAILFGYVAWFIQKVMVFISTGLFFSFLSIVIYIAIDGIGVRNFSSVMLVAFLVFIVAGIISVVLYEYFVILSFTLPATISLFQNSFFSDRGSHGFEVDGGNLIATLRSLTENIKPLLEQYWFVLIFMIISYSIFSVYYQKRLITSEDESPSDRLFKTIFRTLSLLFVVIILLRIYFGESVDSKFYLYITNVCDIYTFPVIVLFSAMLLKRWIKLFRGNLIKQYSVALLTGLFIIPFMLGIIEQIIFLRPLGYIIGSVLPQIGCIAASLIYKEYGMFFKVLMFSFLLFPVCIMYLMRNTQDKANET